MQDGFRQNLRALAEIWRQGEYPAYAISMPYEIRNVEAGMPYGNA